MATKQTIEIDAIKLTIGAAISAVIFVAGLAWTGRGVVAEMAASQLEMENRIKLEIQSNYTDLVIRVSRVEDRLGIRGSVVMPSGHEQTFPASGQQ